jgi:hypothetical protein
MIDPIVEVDRLKNDLRIAGLSTVEVDEIGDLISQDIDNTIFELTQEYLNQARDIVAALGGQQLADELRSIKRGPQFIIGTDSGVTDFSTPPMQMLPHLLKNAKVSKDGHLYKVIPLSSKSQRGPSNIFDVYRDRNANVRQEQQDRQRKWDDVRTANAIDKKSLHFSGLAQAKRYLAKRQAGNKQSAVENKGPVEFRTASSKQDASSDWVLPAKDMNITNILNDINSRLQNEVDNAVTSIVSKYGGLI